MIKIAYYYLDSGLVYTFRTGETIEDFPDPGEGEGAIFMTLDLAMPLYFDGTELQALPEQPGPEYVWDLTSESWTPEIYTAGEDKVVTIQQTKAQVWELGGFWFARAADAADYRRYICTPYTLARYHTAIQAAIMTAPGDPFSVTLPQGEGEVILTFTRADVLGLHAALLAHGQAMDAEDARLESAFEAAYTLFDTDPAGGLAAMLAIEWEYIPSAP